MADDFIREFDAVDLSAKSKRKSAKATNLKDSQYVVALHRDSRSGIMHLHIDANRIDIRGNVNDAHYIYERAMAAAAKVGQQRGWKDAKEVSRQNKEAITNDCLAHIYIAIQFRTIAIARKYHCIHVAHLNFHMPLKLISSCSFLIFTCNIC